MKTFPLGPKRVKLSNHHSEKHEYSEQKNDSRKLDETIVHKELTKGDKQEREIEESNINIVKKANIVTNKFNEDILKVSEITEQEENKPPLKAIVVYHDRSKDGKTKTLKGSPNVNNRNNSNMVFNQRFLHQITLLDIDTLKKFAPKEWLNHSNFIDHPFEDKFKKAKKKTIERVF